MSSLSKILNRLASAREEYGVTDWYGTWLFSDGMFLIGNDGEDHRILGDPFEIVASGEAISLRKSQNGEMCIRVLEDHCYNSDMRQALERVCKGLYLIISYFDYDGHNIRHAESNEDDMLLLSITDPIAYRCEGGVR